MVRGEAEPLYGRHYCIHCCSHIVRCDLSDQRVKLRGCGTYPEKERDLNEDKDHGRNTAHVSLARENDQLGYSQQQNTEEDQEVEIEDIGNAQCKPQYNAEYAGPAWLMSAKLHLTAVLYINEIRARSIIGRPSESAIGCSVQFKGRFARSRHQARPQRYTPLSINTCERSQLHAQAALPAGCLLKFRDLNSSASVISAAGSKNPELPEDHLSQWCAVVTKSVPYEADAVASQICLEGAEVYAAARE